MDDEIKNFAQVWLTANASACYCYLLARIIPPGIIRLFFVLPVIYLFIILPLPLSFFHLRLPTVFYLVWLGNFKLLLFAFDLGPLSSSDNRSFIRFISILLLPINVKPDNVNGGKCHNKSSRSSSHSNSHLSRQTNQSFPKANTSGPNRLIRSVLFMVKLLAVALVVKMYDFSQDLPNYVILSLYCVHLYLGVEITLAISGALVKVLIGLELDPQFNEPYLTTSLQDFWGRRWNLMVSNILRLTVYGPVRRITLPHIGKRGSMVAGMIGAFLVSGLMHEVIYYYSTHMPPTWEVTCFFVLHGVCTALEVVFKQPVDGRFRLHRAVSGLLTILFVGVTAGWLFLPQVLRNGVQLKVISEYPVMVGFVKEKLLSLPIIVLRHQFA